MRYIDLNIIPEEKMKYSVVLALLTFATFSYATDSLPPEVMPAYNKAYQMISEKLGVHNFQVSYEYRIAYEDDQVIRFSFNGDFGNCVVEVRSESNRVVSVQCSDQSKPTDHLICDKNNNFIFLIENGIFQLVEKSKFELIKDWTDLHYSSYGTTDFVSVTFSDQKMENAILEYGPLWPYGDIDQSSVVKTDLSQYYCK